MSSNNVKLKSYEKYIIDFENFHGMIVWKLSENFIMQPEQDILCCKSENGKC